MSKKLFVIIPALYKCGMFSGLIIVRHFIVIFGVHYNDPVSAEVRLSPDNMSVHPSIY